MKSLTQIELNPEQHIHRLFWPKAAEVLGVRWVNRRLVLDTLVDRTNHPETRTFMIYVNNDEVNADKYVGTAVAGDGRVFYVFEVK